MNTQFMTLIIEKSKKMYHFFKNTRGVFLFITLCLYLLVKSDNDVKNNIRIDFERLKTAKKGHILVIARFNGQKSVASIVGKLVESKDTSDVSIETGKYTRFVKSIPIPEPGTMYPVWYTDDLKVVYARDFETPEETVKFFKDLYARQSFKYDPFIILLSFGLFCFVLSDVYNYYKSKK